MQRRLKLARLSEDEEIKEAGLTLDFDEIAQKGTMSKEEKSVAKWYGIYGSRQPGNFMARIVIPGGQITSRQARAIAEIAGRYGRGRCNLTTRQAIQYHWLQLDSLPKMLRDLAKVGLTTMHGCGDVTRNVVACPLATDCPHRCINVLPFAQESARFLSGCRDLDNLPRKFKVTWSGCGAACGQPYINCVGMIALTASIDGKSCTGFKAVIGGGMGWKAFVAEELFSFVPPEHAVALTRAVGLLFRDHGDRYNRAKARLKFVVARQGIDECRRLVLDYLEKEGVATDRFMTGPIDGADASFPARPLVDSALSEDVRSTTLRIRVPKGELEQGQLERVAELAEMAADQRIYTTNRQNLELHHVDPSRIEWVRDEIRKIGLETSGSYGLPDMVPCVGTTYCPKAVTATRDLFDRLVPVVEARKYESIRDHVTVNITGCPNSCSPYRIADIGFRGKRIREAVGSVEGYEMRIGGDQRSFGLVVGEFKVPDCVMATENVLDTFLKIREGDETLDRCVNRVGVAPFKASLSAIEPYAMAPALSEYSQREGRVSGPGDMAIIAKDIPCQEACPVRTDVPAYIEAIARGDRDASFRINQECNVFPGVLGRVCTHPCQDRCRHKWTNTEGPVEICHLKRFATDAPEVAPAPLPPWFPTSGKRVAVVGSGPAGLSAARELRRYGHDVEIFEREGHAGGMMVDGIPRFRLPIDVVQQEIDLVLDSGIAIHYNQDVDAEFLENLIQGHDAVLVAVGTMRSNQLDVQGLTASLVTHGLSFMKRYNANELPAMDGDVIVIGGGFTAVDCARSSARLAGQNGHVTIVYRRSEQHMAADMTELQEMQKEGIDVRTLATPLSVETHDGNLVSVRFQRNMLARECDETGKPRIIPVAGGEFDIPCNHLIVAIGQSRELEILPECVTLSEGIQTRHPKVFVAGDFAGGSADVITAVASGKQASRVVDRFLMNDERRHDGVDIVRLNHDGDTGRTRDHDLQVPPPMPLLPVLARFEENREVELGFDEPDGLVHATRCYLCHFKLEIDQDRCIHCDWCIEVAPRNCIRRLAHVTLDQDKVVQAVQEVKEASEATYIWIDSDECIRCGKCLRVCPTEAISMSRTSCVCN